MALYKYQNYLNLSKNPSFDMTFGPSHHIPCGGIYRCTGCGTEIAIEAMGFFPDRKHHVHGPNKPPVEWQLIVATVSHLPAPYLHGA
jgi:hypothetical protein